MVAEVDDWEELRLAGAAIKDNTLLHLDEHLLRLEESLTARGRDRALGARRRGGVRGRRRRSPSGHGVDEVVKVKSMATAEIDLNEAPRRRTASPRGRPTWPS